MKSYTDLEQSKKLAEILPIESADMCFNRFRNNKMPPLMTPYSRFNEFFNMEPTPAFLIPCWSLAALLEHLRRIDMFPDIIDSVDCVMMDISFADDEDGKVLHPIHCLRVEGKTILDACVEMIVKLHEQKVL